MAPALVVVTGPVGVGKTTVARQVALASPRGVHLQMDPFWFAVVDPALREDASRAIGGAALMAAFAFVEDGGFSVVLDGFLLPDALPEVGAACDARGIPFHYVVLQADVETCLRRANGRAPLEDPDGVRALHARFAVLEGVEHHVVRADGPPEEVARRVLAAVAAGTVTA
jgi:predicted kinase